jgi:hypothetical protein
MMAIRMHLLHINCHWAQTNLDRFLLLFFTSWTRINYNVSPVQGRHGTWRTSFQRCLTSKGLYNQVDQSGGNKYGVVHGNLIPFLLFFFLFLTNEDFAVNNSPDVHWLVAVSVGCTIVCPTLHFISSFVKFSISTVVFHSIRQGPWRVTALPKFWFRHLQNLGVTTPEIRQYSAAGRKILPCWDCDHQTVSAQEKNLCYQRYISAILKAAWCVTAELNEIVQYSNLIMTLYDAFPVQHCVNFDEIWNVWMMFKSV